mmetsp:Transcript_104875/g.327037  ORF Transcript_104875/g.327037 Transcript_104875/m.327037 type:complete len:104 (+) Transcript_104875:59-370(+)
MLGTLVGGALAYANTAYTYNQGRYEFDAGQSQLTAHQLMNFRLAQWNLFREDIRDLFTLTTSHMSTYMVVGTLFLGFAVTPCGRASRTSRKTPRGSCFCGATA